jgi:hypothetical protein
MKESKWVNKILFFLIGAVVMFAFVFLSGAATIPQIGRYQLETASRGEFSDVYVIDTTNGAIKWLDSKQENIPFEQLKVKKGFFN